MYSRPKINASTLSCPGVIDLTLKTRCTKLLRRPLRNFGLNIPRSCTETRRVGLRFYRCFSHSRFFRFCKFCSGIHYGFISPRAFYCWRRNVVVFSSLIYQMFIVTLSLLLRYDLLLVCVPTDKLSVLCMSMVSIKLSSCYHALPFCIPL